MPTMIAGERMAERHAPAIFFPDSGTAIQEPL
jgi:hypothetical protein